MIYDESCKHILFPRAQITGCWNLCTGYYSCRDKIYAGTESNYFQLVSRITCCIPHFQVLYDNRLVKFCRAYLCIIQGTWLIHGGFIMQVAAQRKEIKR